uniref:Chromosome segregation protein SMC n=1 Tax=uncultured prokaryote TaxID=198431 RepID=H5SM11_9ZZZZ|nr:chromosome segregation protein SMC [uncultured prokaryote]
MPLRLKSLELHGYKTFASRTLFEFAPGITAIVGPNGSGKSNISDALRWVLGEQSYGLLRARKTEDMIFAGSESRPRAGMASATALFDNSDGWLPIEFTEVAITRRAYRDGRNEYLLNGQPVRLREINELLAQAGLSERTYTIIGQGLVDASLALKADERRRLFEEAAGIGLYRARREEALRRLENTRHNLERLLDLLAELEPRLKHLERQARRAQEYAQVQADLQLLLRDWYGYHWYHAQEELRRTREILHRQEAQAQEARRAYQQLQEKHAAFRQQVGDLRQQLSARHHELSAWHTRREETGRALLVNEERLRALEQRLAALQDERIRLQEEQQRLESEQAQSQATLLRLQNELREAEENLNEAEGELSDLQADRAVVEESLQQARRLLEKLQTQQSETNARLDETMRRIETLRPRLEQLLLEKQSLEQATQDLERELDRRARACAAAEAALSQAEKEHKAARAALEQAENLWRARQEALREAEMTLTRLRARLEVLEQAEQSLSGYAEGTRLLLEAARQGKLKGIQNILSALLEVPAEYEEAIRAALGESLDAILLEEGSLEEALILLEGDSAERAALLPLEVPAAPPPLMAGMDEEGCLGWAGEHLRAPAELQGLLARLLEGVWIVRDRQTARRLLPRLPGLRALVTLRGEVFRRDGVILAGGRGRPSALTRSRQKRELQSEIERALQKLEEARQELEQAKHARDEAVQKLKIAENREHQARQGWSEAQAAEQKLRLEFQAAKRQREWQDHQESQLRQEAQRADEARERLLRQRSELEAQLEQAQEQVRQITRRLAEYPIEEARQQVTYWKTRRAVADQALKGAQQRHQELEEALARLQTQRIRNETALAEATQQRAALLDQAGKLRFQDQEIQQRLQALGIEIEPLERALQDAEAEAARLQEAEIAAQRALSLAERLLNQAQLEFSRSQEVLENLQRRVNEELGLVQFEAQTSGLMPLPLEGLVETLPALRELPAGLEEQIARQRAQLRRLGPVNPQAQEEYEAERARLAFLKTQIEDLQKAEADLRQLIAELDERTRQEFLKTFQEVDRHFREIFLRLFGGGSARLTLSDPENLVESGIEIEARLPGRREQGLALLSGGERSLTALALVFALLKVSPTPLCVMDEVDAMLDEANVGRFRELLQELSRETQFIIITHNRNTVQAAEVIYGVTMGRDSTSQVLSLRLDEVERM